MMVARDGRIPGAERTARTILCAAIFLAGAGCATCLAQQLPAPRQPVGYDAQAGPCALRVGKVITMDDQNRVLNNAVVLVAHGKIEQVGVARDVPIPAGYRLIEKPDLWLVPGLIDPHNHSAGAMPDLHDYVYLTNPGLRTVEALEPESENNRAPGPVV